MMKKFLLALICLTLLSSMAISASANPQNRRYRVYRDEYSRRDEDRRRRRYDDDYYDDRSIWDKHRDKITTGAGAAGGAAIGAAIGGKKGALIGAIAGGAGAAIYTYKIRKRDNRNY